MAGDEISRTGVQAAGTRHSGGPATIGAGVETTADQYVRSTNWSVNATALPQLAKNAERKAYAEERICFGGMSVDGAAEVLGVSSSRVYA